MFTEELLKKFRYFSTEVPSILLCEMSFYNVI